MKQYGYSNYHPLGIRERRQTRTYEELQEEMDGWEPHGGPAAGSLWIRMNGLSGLLMAKNSWWLAVIKIHSDWWLDMIDTC